MLKQLFREFFQALEAKQFPLTIAQKLGVPVTTVTPHFALAYNEGLFTLDFLAPYLRKDIVMLEVGSGTGLLGSFLVSNGYNAQLLEPGGVGFEFNRSLFLAVTEALSVPPERCFASQFDDFAVAHQCAFDLIFSNNVLEHLPDLERSLEGMSALLKPTGWMIHNAPNYLIPYDPHYGVPLFPFAPRASRFFLPARIIQDGCWRSLNFITVTRVRDNAKRLGASVTFQPKLLQKSFERFKYDVEFRERHLVLNWVYRLLVATGVMGLLGRIPPVAATPMIFEWHKN